MHNVAMKALLTVRAMKTVEANAPEVVDFLHNDLSRFFDEHRHALITYTDNLIRMRILSTPVR